MRDSLYFSISHFSVCYGAKFYNPNYIYYHEIYTIMKLLIADDNERMRSMLKKLVKGVADEIIECSDGKDAVALYNEVRPDYVLMDIQMKEMDGITATRLIKKDFPLAKVIIVSNFSDQKFRFAAGNAGVSGFVPKENLIDILNYMV